MERKTKRKATCSTCGDKGHNTRSCDKPRTQGRHVLPHEACVNGTFWAPYGEKGWSAVRIHTVGYKHARVDRVRPKTQEVVTTKGKVRLDELVKRDPNLIGADRPRQTPDEVFATFRRSRAALEEKEKEQKAMEQTSQSEVSVEVPRAPERTPEEEQARDAAIAKLFDLLEDETTNDDW